MSVCVCVCVCVHVYMVGVGHGKRSSGMRIALAWEAGDLNPDINLSPIHHVAWKQSLSLSEELLYL